MSKIPCPLNKAASQFGSLPAIISGSKIISFVDYEAMVDTVAGRLEKKGVNPETRIGIISHNCWEYVILLLAIFRQRAVACPVSARFPQESIVSILEKTNCTKVIDTLTMLSPAAFQFAENISLEDVFSCGTTAYKDIHGSSDIIVELGDEATIILTSGSSGPPKAALHTYGNHYYNALGSNENICIEPRDRWLLSLPLFHVGGLGIVFRMLLGGGAIVIPEKKESINEAVERYEITHLSLVSTQLHRWLNAGVPKKTIASLKAVLVGGGPVPQALIRRACKAGLPLFTTYGLTEMASQVTTTAPGDSKEKLETSGKVLKNRVLKIEDGQILVKGKTLFKGYVEQKKLVFPIDDQEWFTTGDLGRLDGEGYLTFMGRKDNMFISGGENITPEEIETQLCMLPQIAEAIVVPIRDEEFGFRPVAFVKNLKGKAINTEELRGKLERYLPRFKIPVAFHLWPEDMKQEGIKPHRQYLVRIAEELEHSA